MKWFRAWPLTILAGIFLAIGLLFNVLKSDYLALPDSGYSRGIQLESNPIGSKYDDYAEKTYAVASADHRFYVLTPSESGLKLTIRNLTLEPLETYTFSTFKGNAELAVERIGDYLYVSRYTYAKRQLEFISINLIEHTATLESSFSLPDLRIHKLTSSGLYYADDHHIYFQSQTKNYPLAAADYSESLTISPIKASNNQFICYSNFKDNQYQLDYIIITPDLKILKQHPNYISLGASGAVKPSELAAYVDESRIELLSVIKDNKSGINIVNWYSGNYEQVDLSQMKQFNAYTFSLSPVFYEDEQQKKHLIMTAKTYIGKVEVGTEGQFQNLIESTRDLEHPKGLTKSTRTSINPTWIKADDHYLFYTQIDHGKAYLMVSSDSKELIQHSLKISLKEQLNLLMTSITTFLPMMYISLIIEIYVLTPVLIVIVFISMFKLTWAERHAREMLMTAVGLHLLTKAYFIFKHIVVNSELMRNLPTFLNSPFKFILWSLLMNAISGFAAYQFYKAKPSRHYLQSYIFFNLVDILLFTMLYAPYYLLQ